MEMRRELHIPSDYSDSFKEKAEAVARRCSIKKVLLEISQNAKENTCDRVSFLIKLQALGITLLKKRL